MKKKFIAFLKLSRIQNIYLSFLDSFGVYLFLIYHGSYYKAGYSFAIIIISSFLWMSGVILNDIADINKDKITNNKKVLVTQEISVKIAYLGAFFLQLLALIFTAILFGEFSISILLFLFVFILLIYSYNFLTKQIKLAGSINMGLCRSANCFLPYLMLNQSYGHIQNAEIIYILFYSFLFISYMTYLSYYENVTFSPQKIIIIYLPFLLLLFVNSIFMVSVKRCHIISCSSLKDLIMIHHPIHFFSSSFYPEIFLELCGIFALYLAPSIIKCKIDILSLLHLYIAGLLFGCYLHYKDISTFVIFSLLLLAIYYLRIFILKGVFLKS